MQSIIPGQRPLCSRLAAGHACPILPAAIHRPGCAARPCTGLTSLLQPCGTHIRVQAAAVAAETVGEESAASPAPDAPVAGAAAVDSKGPRGKSQRATARQDDGSRAIVVKDKSAANALLRRLESVPQTVLRAGSPDAQATYRALTTMAAAQRTLQQQQQQDADGDSSSSSSSSNKVLVYVPWTRWTNFIANVLPADAALLGADAPGAPSVVAKAASDPEALASTLVSLLTRHGAAVVRSAGAGACAAAAEGLRLARCQLLSQGYELGVVPKFVNRTDEAGKEMTVLHQVAIAQQLAPPQVIAPRTKALTAAVASASNLLGRQGRLALKVPDSSRLTQLLGGIMEQLPAGAVPRRAQRSQRGPEKKRLLLVSCDGGATAVPAVALPQLADGQEAAGAAAAAAAPPSSHVAGYQDYTVWRSRLTGIPYPRYGLAGPQGGGHKEDRKPAFASAASSITGLAAAIEGRLARVGATWLQTDGTAAGNAAAWEAVRAAAAKMRAWDGQGGLLALVDVTQEGEGAGAGAAAAADQQQQQQTEQGQEQQTEQQQQQQQQQDAPAAVQQQQQDKQQEPDKQQQQQPSPAAGGHRLQMLIVRDGDVPRSLLQAPNTPLESSGASSEAAMALLRFAAAVNTFLPLSADSGAGGLVMLPAVLASAKDRAAAAAAGATDYRFASSGSQLPLGFSYSFRLQRCTAELAGGVSGPDVAVLRVAGTTDPAKLRDAVVAKVLQGQPATLTFVATPGSMPPALFGAAVTAVAAARVRLLQKGTALDVGVMPFNVNMTADAAGGGQAGDQQQAQQERQLEQEQEQEQQAGGEVPAGKRRQQGMTVYSLRLVPVPVAAGDAQQLADLAAE